MVRVNGVPRKASQDVKAEDELEFPLYNRVLKVRVLSLPEGNVKKADQWSLFEVLEDKRLPLDLGFGQGAPQSLDRYRHIRGAILMPDPESPCPTSPSSGT